MPRISRTGPAALLPALAPAILIVLRLASPLGAEGKHRGHAHVRKPAAAAPAPSVTTKPAKMVMAQPAPKAPAYLWHLALTDQRGKPYDIAEARGKTLLVSFLFTSCGSACPMQTSRLVKVQGLLTDSLKARSRFVSISIDPEHDSSMVLGNYADVFRADTRHWRFAATRDTAALHRFMASLGVTVKPGAGAAPDHQMAVTLVDAHGRVAQRYIGNTLDEARVAAEIADVDRLFGKAVP